MLLLTSRHLEGEKQYELKGESSSTCIITSTPSSAGFIEIKKEKYCFLGDGCFSSRCSFRVFAFATAGMLTVSPRMSFDHLKDERRSYERREKEVKEGGTSSKFLRKLCVVSKTYKEK